MPPVTYTPLISELKLVKSPGAADALGPCTPPMATIATREMAAAVQRRMALWRVLDLDVVVATDVGRLAEGVMLRR